MSLLPLLLQALSQQPHHPQCLQGDPRKFESIILETKAPTLNPTLSSSPKTLTHWLSLSLCRGRRARLPVDTKSHRDWQGSLDFVLGERRRWRWQQWCWWGSAFLGGL
ncbi:hypothetical protein TIFTF001_030735 [Ficus carica]|uniref:Uncharacterized protein n=1 Tax=Ficus carica TaxID=3494 RepID=A0AA88DU60_FICCA|nr:hypothetical protein TIFTF001_030735 [Ficus carica]